jgi:outer membrane protein assembly factor BamB
MNKQPYDSRQWKHRMHIVALTITVALCAIACRQVDPGMGWPTYRHDATRSGVTPEALSPRLSLAWAYRPAHAPQPAWHMPAEEMARMHFDNTYHVSAANGLAYFGSSVDNKLYALDISNGELRWEFFTEGPVRFSPSILKNRIYFGSDDGYVYCLNAKNGKLRWKYSPGPKDRKVIGNGRMISRWPVRTSVLVDQGTVYFGAGVFPYDGLYICALNARDGSIIWKNDDLDDEAFELMYGGISPQSYLIASKTRLFVPSGRAMPAVFDRENGKFLHYLTPSGKQGGTWGMIDQGELVAGVDRSGTPTKVAYDIETGAIKGDVYASFTGIDMIGTPDCSYIVTKNGIFAIDRVKYPEIQRKIDSVKTAQEEVSNLSRRRIYAAMLMGDTSFEKQLEELTNSLRELSEEEEKLETTSSEWFFPQEGLQCAVLSGDQIIAGGAGIVLGLDMETGKELWRDQVEGIAHGLSVSDNRLIVSTDTGMIYCYSGDEAARAAKIPEGEQPAGKETPAGDEKTISAHQHLVATILKETGLENGFCLVLDGGEGQLVKALAERSKLHVIGLERDARKVQKAKLRLDKAGLYGSRGVVEDWDIHSLPEYFASLVVSLEFPNPAQGGYSPDEIFRILTPGRGIAIFRRPSPEDPSPGVSDLDELLDRWESLEVQTTEIQEEEGSWMLFARKDLAGAGGWTHQYGDPANTSCSDDQLVRAPFSTLWYGSPGPQMIPERHARGASPVALDGRLIVEGENSIMAYDAYNGTMLWQREIEGANRVRVDADGGNLAVNQHGLFVAAKDACHQLDPGTGETVRIFSLPADWQGKARRWAYVAVKDNVLFGSAGMPLEQDYAQLWDEIIDEDGSWKEADEMSPVDAAISTYYRFNVSEDSEDVDHAFQRDGTKWRQIADFPAWSPGIAGLHNTTGRMMSSDGIFAFDIASGELLWVHKGSEIAQISISVGEDALYFAENRISAAHRQQASYDKQRHVRAGKWEEFEVELGPDEADVRMVYSLDIFTGRKRWEKVVDLSGCGDDLTASGYQKGVLLFFGSYGLHDKFRFPAGELKWHRITALSAQDGELMWSRPLNYMVRPLLIQDEIIIEPRKCDLYTGKIKSRIHPVTGEDVPWEFYRPGHTCAATSANEHCLFYRSYNAAYYDLKEDKGLSYYGAIRPGCWINMIPGNGLVLFPEASSGCTCSFPLRTSVVLKPEKNEEVEDWSLYISHGPLTPVQHLAINLGAPGDKKDKDGTIWFGYPRPNNPAGLMFDITAEILDGMGYYSYDSKGVEVEGEAPVWLLTNGCIGLVSCQIPLINDLFGEEPGIYTVRLGFAAPSTRRKFDINIQDEMVLENLDVLREAGGVNRPVIKEFSGISVNNRLSLAFIPETTPPEMDQAPVINFIEIIREDAPAGPEPSHKEVSLNREEAAIVLAQASKELEGNQITEALEKYHMVLNSRISKRNKIKALEGMETIASIRSLPEIKHYCQSLDPVMWDYQEPDQELIDAAVKVYIAIARTVAKENKNLAIEMLNQALSLTTDVTARKRAVHTLSDLGVTNDNLVDGTLNGMAYQYYEGNWLVMPDFESLTPVRTGTVFEFGLDQINHRDDFFGIRYTGYLRILKDGRYDFYTRSDDGTNLYIGEELVVSNDGTHGVKEASGSISLQPGRYPIRVDYFESGGEEDLEVLYKGPDVAKQTIPASSLFKLPD